MTGSGKIAGGRNLRGASLGRIAAVGAACLGAFACAVFPCPNAVAGTSGAGERPAAESAVAHPEFHVLTPRELADFAEGKHYAELLKLQAWGDEYFDNEIKMLDLRKIYETVPGQDYRENPTYLRLARENERIRNDAERVRRMIIDSYLGVLDAPEEEEDSSADEPQPDEPAGTPPAPKRYTAGRGDTPTRIAKNLGCSVKDLQAANSTVDFSALKVGMELNVPAKDSAKNQPSPAPAPAPKSAATPPPVPAKTRAPAPPPKKETPAAKRPVPEIAQKAVEKIPTEKYALISAYEKSGMTWLEGNTPEFLALCDAFNCGDTATIVAILDAFPQLADQVYTDTRSGEKRTLLVWFCSRDRRSDELLVKTLIEKGADVNAVSSKGNTALLGAAKCGNAAIVRILLDAGAVADESAVAAARSAGVRQMLFDARKNFTQEDLRNEMNAKRLSASNIERILKSGVRPTDDMLFAAVGADDAEVLDLLIRAGGNVNAVHPSKGPLIYRCPFRGDISCAKLLVDYGADTNFTLRISGRTSYLSYLKSRKADELVSYIESAKSRPKKQIRPL